MNVPMPQAMARDFDALALRIFTQQARMSQPFGACLASVYLSGLIAGMQMAAEHPDTAKAALAVLAEPARKRTR